MSSWLLGDNGRGVAPAAPEPKPRGPYPVWRDRLMAVKDRLGVEHDATIAAEIGCCPATVGNYRRKLGIAPLFRTYKPGRDERLVREAHAAALAGETENAVVERLTGETK